jgi:hypothetical protein
LASDFFITFLTVFLSSDLFSFFSDLISTFFTSSFFVLQAITLNAHIVACAFVNLFVDQNLLVKTFSTHIKSIIFLVAHHDMIHVQGQAGINKS